MLDANPAQVQLVGHLPLSAITPEHRAVPNAADRQEESGKPGSHYIILSQADQRCVLKKARRCGIEMEKTDGVQD